MTTLLHPDHPAWPTGLRDLPDAPAQLWARGNIDMLETGILDRALAVVGSRSCTTYGASVAGTFADQVDATAIVTGGAFGIDVAATRAALVRGIPPVVVLPCGVDIAYPAAHRDLLNSVVHRGVLLSAVPPGTQPTRTQFRDRARIVAAISRATLVVEAAQQAAALVAAHTAHDLGRPLMAVPGPITSATSAGCHDLIRSGRAVLVADALDVNPALAIKEHA